jgi:DNA-binding HxlR family transcriptional regulator
LTGVDGARHRHESVTGFERPRASKGDISAALLRGAPVSEIAMSDDDAYNPRMNRTMNPVHESTTCAVAASAEIIGAKWTALLVHDLSEGPRRFSQLERSCCGISPRTLAERLRALEGEGIVVRQSYPESPPRVEYELTDKGEALLPIIDAMRDFGHSHLHCEHDHSHSH